MIRLIVTNIDFLTMASFWCLYFFIVNSEKISIVNFEQVNAGWVYGAQMPMH